VPGANSRFADRMKCARPGQQARPRHRRPLEPRRLATRICCAGGGSFSSAARRVKVNSNKRRGSAPPRISPRHPVRQRLGFWPVPAPAAINSGGNRPLFRTDAKGSGAALRRVSAPREARQMAGAVFRFPFHRNRITSPVRRRNPTRSRHAKASLPGITDRGYDRSSSRIVGCAKRACPTARTRVLKHLRLNASVSGALRGTEGSNPSPSSGRVRCEPDFLDQEAVS